MPSQRCWPKLKRYVDLGPGFDDLVGKATLSLE
jgi:hypothetical protein